MRLSTVTKTALSAAAALVLLTACGGADEESTAAGSSGSSGSSAASTSSSSEQTTSEAPAEDVAAFCQQGQAVVADVSSQLSTATPETIPGVLQQVVAGLDTLTPPADLAGDFTVLRDAYAQLSDAASSVDLTTEDGQAAFQQTYNDVTAQATSAEEAVGTWIQDNCGTTG